jgi:hypothetical protein
MAKCPKCGSTINHLNAYSLEVNKQTVELDEGGKFLEWGGIEAVECSCIKIDFKCPHCAATLFKGKLNEENIMQFLKGD